MASEDIQRTAIMTLVNSVTLASKRGGFSLTEENSYSDRSLRAIRAFKADLELPGHLSSLPILTAPEALNELGALVTIAHDKGLFELLEQSVLGAALRVFQQKPAAPAPVPTPVPEETSEAAAEVDALLAEAEAAGDEAPSEEKVV